MTLTLDNRSAKPILYRGQRFSLLVRLLLDGTVDWSEGIGYGLSYGLSYGGAGADEVTHRLLSQTGDTVLAGPIAAVDSGRSNFAQGLVDCIIPGASSTEMAYEGDAILEIQIVGGATYRQTVRVV